MAQILSQEEVDALLKGVVSGEIETETEAADTSAKEGPQHYDFGAQDKVIRGRMPTLDAINDRFARFFRNSLSNMLRRMVDVTPVSLDTLKFGNFIRSLAVPSSIHIVRIEPLRGNALVVLETKLVFALIDSFFGGAGGGVMKVEGREFTAIEQRMLYNVVTTSLRELENAWKPVYEMDFSYVRGEMNPQFAGIIPNEDVLIVVQFDVEMEETSGNIMICIPYMLIEPIRERLYASFHTEEKQNVDTEWINRFKKELMSVYINMSVELGHTKLTSRELTSLKAGDIILLDEDTSDPLLVNVERLPKFLAKPGKLNDNMAVEVIGPVIKQLSKEAEMAEEKKTGGAELSQDVVDEMMKDNDKKKDVAEGGGGLSQNDIDSLLGGGEDSGSGGEAGADDEQARLAAEWASALETGAEIEEGKGIKPAAKAEPARFNELPGDKGGQQPPRDLDFILDIPLDVTVEIGRTKMLINDLLQIGQGSVIELNRLAGEPLDILVNNKLIARGEVVVVSEKFGIRITDIVSPMERVKRLA